MIRQNFIICALLCALSHSLSAQTPWLLDSTIERRMYTMGMPGKATPVPPGTLAPSYAFEMAYDSICHVNYLFTEFRLNGKVLNLAHWQDGRLVEGNAQYLTYNSRTFTFPVHAGDTVSFYRELQWYHPFTHWQDTNSYYALDTLEFVAHLVRASDGVPLVQMDSTGIMPRTTMGAPWIYGGRPLMAIVRYVIPAAVQGDSAFIGVTVHANGSGKNNFTRLDGYTINVSHKPMQAEYQRYLDYFSATYAKHATGDFAQPGDERFTLTATSAPGASRDIGIGFTEPDDVAGRVSVNVYDVNGSLLFSPYTSSAGSGAHTVRYRAPVPGTYFVALLSDERIVRTRKIVVQ